MVIVNGSVDDRWCDLPRRKSFVPLVDRLLLQLQSAGIRRQFESGETIAIALPEQFDIAQPPRVKSPTGRTVNSTLNKTSIGPGCRCRKPTKRGFIASKRMTVLKRT